MWILENEGGAFEGRRLWLRPGKRYLFGRTVAEPGQLAIKGDLSKSVSRKHCTITVDAVAAGDGRHPNRRSGVTVEDLGSKGGTRINELKIKNDKVVLTQDENTLQMGSFQSKFTIKWQPVVLSYSFTAKELRADPLSKLQETLEQLDIKYVSDYDVRNTTHVVTRKRNTPKGLQALVAARYIVTNEFVDAVIGAASAPEDGDGYEASPLEGDFNANWPDAIKYLPIAAEDAAPMADENFAPDPRRAEIFDGYTFIFYNKNQWEQLMAPITSGKGKALLREVVAKETEVDEFIRYIKGVAGEKGLGEFEDGSEGKGVVVVRWMPNDGDSVHWFEEFYTTISLRLDHRLIDQKDFIGAIVNNNPSTLRRPLEEEDSQSVVGEYHRQQTSAQSNTDVVGHMPSRRAPLRSRRGKVTAGSRFKGFGIDIDDDDDEPIKPTPPPARPQASGEPSQESLFVAQDDHDSAITDSARESGRYLRKRPASPSGNQVDIMEGFAPTAAQVKRRRVEAGEDPIPRRASPAPEMVSKPATKPAKVKKEMDVLGVARQHREAAEARARAEREELEAATEGLDLAEIRRLQITEEMPLREAPATRTREQDIADGRWDPAWNGRKNFKKFQKRGAEQGRALLKIIVPLEQVQNKAFGIGADYWLEDESQQRSKKKQAERSQKSTDSRNNTQTQDDAYEMLEEPQSTVGSRGRRAAEKLPEVDSDEDIEEPAASRSSARPTGTAETFPEEEDDDDDVVISMSAPRSSRSTAATAGRQSQQQASQRPTASRSTISTTQRSSQPSRGTAAAMASIRGKRPAATALPTREQPASKRAKAAAPPSDDESEDELRFRFKGRR